MASRFSMAAAVVVAMLAFLLTLMAQPSEGTVTGICTDVRTGQPLANATVTLTRQMDDSEADEPKTDGTAEDARGQSAVPSGWSQNSDHDDEIDAAGRDSGPRSEWSTQTDDKGRFTLVHVATGQYAVDAYASGHTLDRSPSVVVAESGTTGVSLRLGRDAPTLSFVTPTRNWTPDEDPTLSLSGTLETEAVQFSVEKLDVDGALMRRPQMLALEADDTQDKKPLWPGEYSAVRHWIYTVAAADKDEDGKFLERVPLGTLPLGLYRVTARASDDGKTVEDVSWVLVTRLALVRKSDHTQMLAFVVDLVTGRPVPNLPVTLYDKDEHTLRTLSQARTGADGLAHLSLAGGSPESQGVVVARDGASVVALTIDLNSRGDETSGPAGISAGATDGPSLRQFIYTDRPVYRPGQTVNLKGITRWFMPGTGFTIPSHQTVTVDVKDAQETLVSHQQLQTDDLGAWNGTLPLSSEALTGEYTIHAAMGSEASDRTFRVQTYHKPEYQATLTFSKDHFVHGEPIQATLTATYYYGAPVAGAKATISAYRGETSDTVSSDPAQQADEGTTAGEPAPDDQAVTLDGNGQAHLQFPTKDDPNDGSLNYHVIAYVDDGSTHNAEADGDVTVAQGLFSLTAAPAAEVARPGPPIPVTIKAVRGDGSPQTGADVEIEVGYDANVDGEESFQQSAQIHATTGPDGVAETTVPAPHNGHLLLRLSSHDTRGNRITTESEVWISDGVSDIPAVKMADLALTLDKKKYAVGETAHLLITTSHPGPSALVTMEGRGLYRAVVVPLTRHANAVDLPVGPEDDPGVTVSVCCVLAKQFRESAKPITTLVVSDDQRALRVAVTADRADYHPGDPATLTVRTTDQAGRPVPAEVSLGVVDSAVYAIMPEPPDTIGDAMMPAQNSGVLTDNSCPQIREGDVDKGSTNIDIRRKFPDTALWKPDIRTGPDGRATVAMDLPDTLTTWRITCVGQTARTQVGKGIGAMTVNKDLLVRLETPPFLTAGDTGTLTALVHNNTRSPLQAQVRLAATGLSVMAGNTTRTIEVAPGQPALLTWDVRSAQPSQATVQLTARAGRLSDGVEETVPVIPHGATQHVWTSGDLLQRVSKDVTLDPLALPGSTRLRVRLSPSLSSAFMPAVDYLDAYPYGSTDATTGVLVADAALAKGAGGLPLSDAQRKKLSDTVTRSVLRLARFQNPDGGWGWFSTDRSDLWMTADAAWGLVLAHDAGYAVNPALLTGAGRCLRNMTIGANRRATSDSRFALAALALAGLGENAAALNDLHALQRGWAAHPETADPTDMAMAALAAQRLSPTGAGLAQTLMADLWAVCRQTGGLCSWTMAAHRSQQGVDEDLPATGPTAWSLLAAEAITPADPRLDGAARWLMLNRSDDHWTDSTTTAIAVLGVARYMARAQEARPDFTAHLIVNGQTVRQIHFGTESLSQSDQVIDLPGTALKPGANTVSLEKTGPGRLYYALDLSQCLRQPAPPPPPTLWTRLAAHIEHPGGVPLPPAPSGYRVKRVYLRLTSRRNFLWEDTVPAPDTHLSAGESILVRLIVQCTRPSSRVVIEEPVPAGCRIAETAGDGPDDWDNWWDYTDVRDDRIVFFIRDLTRGEHEIDYHLQAQTPGTFDVMPTLLTSTVDPNLNTLGAHADQIRIDPKG
jgi:uncharacterized protein YfaS (alpha-2-macroglobulin family)